MRRITGGVLLVGGLVGAVGVGTLWGAAPRVVPVAGDTPNSMALTTSTGPLPLAQFDAEGNLVRPEGYRAWVLLGVPLTPNDMNDGEAPFPEFHNVYIHPTAWDLYKRSGQFPDGTLIVKELVSVGSKAAASGLGYFMGDFIGLEATVKDSQRFPDEPGGWAYFRFSTPDHTLPYLDKARAFPTASCASCHTANAEQDMVFTQYYPVARAAREEARDDH